MISNSYNLSEDWGWYVDIENMRPIYQIKTEFVKTYNKKLNYHLNRLDPIEEDAYDYYINNKIERDYEEEKSKEFWGIKAQALFDWDGLPWNDTILKEGEYLKNSDTISKTTSYTSKKIKLWQEFPSLSGLGSGSNSWALSSKKTKNGHSILANDPHLDLKTPMFWYWIHLKGAAEVMGASLPGVPMIPSGTNGKVAWGLTNSYLKAASVFFLKDYFFHNTQHLVAYLLGNIFLIHFQLCLIQLLHCCRKLLLLEVYQHYYVF